MYLRTALVFVATLLSACGSIQHKTPEARQHIKEDLKLTEITDTSFTSFCWMSIGGPAGCRATPGISVLTPDSLVLVDYERGTYVQKDVIKSENVRCIHQADGKTFHVFTDRTDVMIMPLTDEPGSPMLNNAEYREKAIKVLLSNGQPYVKGVDAPMIVSSNDKFYQVATTNLPGGPITTPVAINVGRIVSPCLGN